MEKKPKLVVQLPIDIESEILSRLPIKSLMRFRCVSEPWNALISSYSFQLLHFDHHSPHTHFPLITTTSANTNLIRINHFSTHLPPPLIRSRHVTPTNYDIPTHFPPPLIRSRHVTPTNSCRGLVCLVNSDKDRVFICNPSTREILELPPMPIEAASHYVTFCYASASNRFKVVNFFEELSHGRRSPIKCRVFTLGTAAWRDISCPLPHKYYFPKDEPVLHDTIHFLPANDWQDEDVSIHCFHYETEEFTEIQLPDELVEGQSLWEGRYLMELGGFLALNFYYGDRLEIWLLKDYNEEEWVKEYIIDLTDNGAISPVAILPDGSLLLNVEDIEVESYPSAWVLRRYDPVLGKIGDTLQKDSCLWMQCVESCFSPSPRLM